VKKLVILLMLPCYLISCSLIVVPEPDQVEQVRPKIKCCFQDARCVKTTRDDCALKTGIEVEDCYECPAVWGERKQKE
jgi:hypothetical protein